MNRPCLACGTLSPTPRCPACTRQQRSIYGGTWRATSRAAITAHVQRHGWMCLGDQHHAAHATTDLTTDHVTAGTLAGGLAVMCRASNTAKAKRGG